ncbi:stAR-related lipid transfer protein 5-like [Dysidea avara]|uniref:stAR-related lipid transfer protein 5-like n=1 Tax=Dysidea avara TaxID=196820 RepID=UPI0033240F9E
MAEGNSQPADTTPPTDASADASSPDYLKIIANHREELLTAMKATDWVETKNKDGIRITYRMTDKGKMFRCEYEVDASPKVSIRYCSPAKGPLNGLREKFRKSALKSVEIIEETEKYFITREVLGSAMMGLISERDLICVYGWDTETEDKGAYILHPSIEHPKYPPKDKPVRAIKHAGGHFFFPVEGNPDKSNVVVLIVLNMGGMLPVSVVDSFQTGAMFDFATQWKDAAAKKFHESN